ncbi:MAG: chemotaxis protein [Vibrionaceae bacterium]
MSDMFNSVNQRSQLAGQNRMELLTFRLMNKQKYGINVFKVREVLQCPKLTVLPKLHRAVKGIASIRGKTISIIDLSLAIGGEPINDAQNRFVVITEFNRSMQGFLVGSVDRIVNMRWDVILPPPPGMGDVTYLTAVTQIDNELVELLDVEKILDEISVPQDDASGTYKDISALFAGNNARQVLVVDDSSIARNQIKKVLESMGFHVILACNGKEGLAALHAMASNENGLAELALVVSDIEMPEIDGYTLTAEIKKTPEFKDVKVLLHSSLSGNFNMALAERVGADAFIPKFNSQELSSAVVDLMKK